MTLNQFAARYGLSDRHARRLLADNEQALSGHYERRGGKATLIDEVAADYLQSLLRNPVSILPEEEPALTQREAALMMKLSEATAKLADAERRAGENAAAAGKVFLLEADNQAQKDKIADLSVELGQMRERAAQAEKTAQAVTDELTAIKSKWFYKWFAKKE